MVEEVIEPEPHIGIDLGTTFTAACIFKNGQVVKLPDI